MTALLQMAAARPPGIADARVPCPLCGGLIHPVAGRCKHCKEDLSSFRAGRPQAAAALPALNGKPANGSNGHAAATAIPVFVPTQEASQPILPPRSTQRSLPVVREHSLWRSWPMLVIALAVIAIVAATVIMLMPPGRKTHDGKMSAPPAPERMDSNPIPEKQSQTDPWDNGQGNNGLGNIPRAAPDPQPQQPQDPDDNDLLGGGGGITGSLDLQGGAFTFHVFDHACKKLRSCPGVDQSMLTTLCDSMAMMPKPPVPSCPAAQKCLEAIDNLSCSQASADALNPASMFSMFKDCVEADQC